MTPRSAEAQTKVSFNARDGWVITADVYGTGPRGLVLVHGGRLTKESWRTQAEQFRAAGFHVIALDLRGFGQSRPAPMVSASEDRKELDVVAAVNYLRLHGAARVSLMGGSMGGDAAADAAVILGHGAVEHLVLLSSAGGQTPERITVGKLLVVAARDDQRSNGVRRFPDIQAGYDRIVAPKSMLVVEGTAHGQAIFDSPDGPRVIEDVLRFLGERTGHSLWMRELGSSPSHGRSIHPLDRPRL